ncbi:MAG TPA: hypothetical protein VMU12_01640 [Candidatus Paceibacterota bacterium]|nr:hypothetical protein [Candidatus Paceibacterota bacterium]
MSRSKTETKDHEIRRDDFSPRSFHDAGIGGLWEHEHTTSIKDKETGATGEGKGRTKEEADSAAYEALQSANEARKR